MNIVQRLLSFYVLFTILSSALTVFFIELYGNNHNFLYLIFSFISSCIFIFFVYKMTVRKYETVIINLSAKVFPMIVLTLLSIFILHKKLDFNMILGLFLVFMGGILISK